uniref:GPS domain-containing protein n=1 Tax=Macrostomum lignano TaxID=282301 RepID=A0A1I8FEC7_9PLAT
VPHRRSRALARLRESACLTQGSNMLPRTGTVWVPTASRSQSALQVVAVASQAIGVTDGEVRVRQERNDRFAGLTCPSGRTPQPMIRWWSGGRRGGGGRPPCWRTESGRARGVLGKRFEPWPGTGCSSITAGHSGVRWRPANPACRCWAALELQQLVEYPASSCANISLEAGWSWGSFNPDTHLLHQCDCRLKKKMLWARAWPNEGVGAPLVATRPAHLRCLLLITEVRGKGGSGQRGAEVPARSWRLRDASKAAETPGVWFKAGSPLALARDSAEAEQISSQSASVSTAAIILVTCGCAAVVATLCLSLVCLCVRRCGSSGGGGARGTTNHKSGPVMIRGDQKTTIFKGFNERLLTLTRSCMYTWRLVWILAVSAAARMAAQRVLWPQLQQPQMYSLGLQSQLQSYCSDDVTDSGCNFSTSVIAASADSP